MCNSRWGGDIFSTCPDRPWGPPSLLYNGYLVFPGGIERPGPDADPLPLLVSWSRKSRAIPLLPLWAVRPVQSLSACKRAHFAILYIIAWKMRNLNKSNVLPSNEPVNRTLKKTGWENNLNNVGTMCTQFRKRRSFLPHDLRVKIASAALQDV